MRQTLAIYLVRHTSGAFCAAVLVALLIVSGCSQSPVGNDTSVSTADSQPLVFVAVPNQQAPLLRESFQSILDMLQKETGREVRFVSATDYNAVIEGLRTGSIQIANLGPFSYVIAKDQGVQITVVAAQVTNENGSRGYQSYGITRPGLPIKSLAGFRGKKVCFVDRASTSGYLYPIAGLLEVGIGPDEDITPIFVGGHDASVISVINGQCDAGFAYDTMVDRQLIERGQIMPGQIATVWKSSIIPGAPLVIANNLPPELFKKLQGALQYKANIDYLRANGFCKVRCGIPRGDAYSYVRASDADYNSVREVCRITRDKSCH